VSVAWDRHTIHEDYIEGEILDLSSPEMLPKLTTNVSSPGHISSKIGKMTSLEEMDIENADISGNFIYLSSKYTGKRIILAEMDYDDSSETSSEYDFREHVVNSTSNILPCIQPAKYNGRRRPSKTCCRNGRNTTKLGVLSSTSKSMYLYWTY
jgi:hypothetical protein